MYIYSLNTKTDKGIKHSNTFPMDPKKEVYNVTEKLKKCTIENRV